MKWLVLYQITSGDFEGVGAAVNSAEKLSSGAEAHSGRALYAGPFEAQGELKPRPPKETARAQAGMPMPREAKRRSWEMDKGVLQKD